MTTQEVKYEGHRLPSRDPEQAKVSDILHWVPERMVSLSDSSPKRDSGVVYAKMRRVVMQLLADSTVRNFTKPSFCQGTSTGAIVTWIRCLVLFRVIMICWYGSRHAFCPHIIRTVVAGWRYPKYIQLTCGVTLTPEGGFYIGNKGPKAPPTPTYSSRGRHHCSTPLYIPLFHWMVRSTAAP